MPVNTPTRSPITVTTSISLTLWTIEEISPNATPAGKLWQMQFSAFQAANPNLTIQLINKKPYGKGGILDFLQTTSAVVPAQLPDVVVIDIAELAAVNELGILQPLDGLLPAELNDDFFPFAYRAARVQNRWVAVPFYIDAQHLVYNTALVKKPPATWNDFLKQKETLLLPLGGDDAFLVQYAALAPVGEIPAIDPASAALVLDFFKRAHEAGLLSDATLGLKSVNDVWALYAAGQAPMAQVAASAYLSERAKLPAMQYAPLPTRDGKIATVASGWAFAITTTNPARQAAAARLIGWLISNERLAPWLRAANRLPATRSTLNATVQPAEYANFLRDELEHAVYLPRTAVYQKSTEAWRAAIANVWKGQTTPDEAARMMSVLK